ncbi:MAG TPA: type II secretion system minor pseudopilin GspK [Steroidobacteraceae bacterium]|nr:type II secretion system minor pseudopilin GspK [Steroidobacteraceae bacterium]
MRRHERGVALLTAILLVALGTIIAVTIGYETALTAARGAGAMWLDQSILVAEAAEAIAGYALQASRSMGTSSGSGTTTGTGTGAGSPADSLNQPWAQVYGPVEITPGVTLQASLEDLQDRFNLNNLVDDHGQIDPNALQAFQTLLQNLGLETKWAYMLADWIDADSIPDGPDGAEDSVYLAQTPPYRPADRQITSTSELLALPGFGPVRYAQLAPYVAALPRGTRVNVCTASGQVLDALNPTGEKQWSTIDPQTLAKQRQSDGCYPTLQEYQAPFQSSPGAANSLGVTAVGQQSDYFRLTTIVNIGSARFYLYSLLHREQNKVHVIQRTFTAD